MATRIPQAVADARIDYVRQVLTQCFSGNKTAFGRRLTHKDGSYVGQMLRGEKPIHERTLAEIAALPEVKGTGLLPPAETLQVAHALSLGRAETVPSTTWEQIEMGDAQNVFRLPIDTVEMEPRVRRGTWCQFSRRLASDARPGDGVLVTDKTGELHLRVYRAGRPGTWEAHAENNNYQPLLSDRDELQVIAVLTAVEGRWNE